jgi:hypothetical protein
MSEIVLYPSPLAKNQGNPGGSSHSQQHLICSSEQKKSVSIVVEHNEVRVLKPAISVACLDP